METNKALPRIEIREGPLGKAVYAAETIPAGRLILRGWGPRLPERTRHSFQVDLDFHVRIEGPIELINHSCDPNCGVRVPRGENALEIWSRRPIPAGEELRTDYASFEWEIVFMPQPCLCGTAMCRTRITGYKDLPAETRRAYQPFIADYLPELEAMRTAVSRDASRD